MNSRKASIIERKLHEAILDRSDVALSQLYDLHSEHVIQSLKNRYPKVYSLDNTKILDAVNQGFFGYYSNPSTFDPNKNSLKRFLEIASERDLLNILEKDKKYGKRKNLSDSVELQEVFWNRVMGNTDSTDSELIHGELFKRVNDILVKYFHTNIDLELAKLILSGERKTDSYSKVLGIEKNKIEIQRREVKKHKDRIKKVIQRHALEQKIKDILE